MTDQLDRLLWAYRAVFTQTNVGGGVINVVITPTERTLFLYGSIGPDDYAADRTIRGFLQDSLGNHLGHVIFTTPLDNEVIPIFLLAGTAAVANATTLDPTAKIVVGRGERLVISATTPVQNETLTITIRALIEQSPPTIATTGSGGTVTTTTTYDKVI